MHTVTKPSVGWLGSTGGPSRPVFHQKSTHSTGRACSRSSYSRDSGRICSRAMVL